MGTEEDKGINSTLNKRKKIRGGHRAAATVLVDKLRTELQNEEKDEDEVAALCEELQKQRTIIAGLDEEIHRDLAETDIEADVF